MSAGNEKLVMRFVELLVESATRNGQHVSRWTSMTLVWRRILTETVPAFLDELGYRATAEMPIDERREDEHIRLLCDNLTSRQRLKTYRQLYALGCRIDSVDRAIDKLTKPR
jgi:hypothetical protein